MATAPVLEVCDALVAAIEAAWNPVAPDAVVRDYVSAIKVGQLTGRRVFVFPLRYSNGPADRGEDLNEYAVGVVVVERYRDGGVPPKEWTDERVNFVHGTVSSPLDFGGGVPVLVVGDGLGLWTETADVTVYDPVALNKDFCFWSDLDLVLKEVR